MKHTLIEVHNVSQQFELETEVVTVLKDVSFGVQEGSFTIIYGPSGSGKSTMLNIILGLQEPSEGQVLLLDQDVYSLAADGRARLRQLTLGVVYQTNTWISSLNVLENVAFPLYLSGYDFKMAQEMASFSLREVGMSEFAKQAPGKLSAGQQQRVSMARALVTNPQIIVADEPTGNLDSANAQLMMKLLDKSVTEHGKTVILVTHNMEYLPYSSQRLEIRDGELRDKTDEHKARST